MPLHVKTNSVHGAPQNCVLNDGTSRCQWRRNNGAQCKLNNAQFQMDMDVYNGTHHYAGGEVPTNKTTADTIAGLLDRGNLLIQHTKGVQTFCWTHANKITGLRVTKYPGESLRGLSTTRNIKMHEIIAAFALSPISENEADNRYGATDTGPFLIPWENEHMAPVNEGRSDGLCARDFGDYANDVRINIARNRRSGNRHTDADCNVGPRNSACWGLTPVEKLRKNAKMVSHKLNNPRNGIEHVMVLQATKHIWIGEGESHVPIRWNYGHSYWQGHYCTENNDPWAKECNHYQSSYNGGRGRGRGRGRGSGGGSGRGRSRRR